MRSSTRPSASRTRSLGSTPPIPSRRFHGNLRPLHRDIGVDGKHHRRASQASKLPRERHLGALPDKRSSRDFAHEKHTKAPEGATTGATAGGLVGGALGLLAGIGLLAIPGVGPFIAAGPIMAALSGAALGAATGGVAGALIGMGMPEIEAKRYEGKISEGKILISVHAETSEEIKSAKDIFEKAGASDITSTAEKSVPKPASQDAPEVVTRSTTRGSVNL